MEFLYLLHVPLLLNWPRKLGKSSMTAGQPTHNSATLTQQSFLYSALSGTRTQRCWRKWVRGTTREFLSLLVAGVEDWTFAVMVSTKKLMACLFSSIDSFETFDPCTPSAVPNTFGNKPYVCVCAHENFEWHIRHNQKDKILLWISPLSITQNTQCASTSRYLQNHPKAAPHPSMNRVQERSHECVCATKD